jgi:hypothetical protein
MRRQENPPSRLLSTRAASPSSSFSSRCICRTCRQGQGHPARRTAPMLSARRLWVEGVATYLGIWQDYTVTWFMQCGKLYTLFDSLVSFILDVCRCRFYLISLWRESRHPSWLLAVFYFSYSMIFFM